MAKSEVRWQSSILLRHHGQPRQSSLMCDIREPLLISLQASAENARVLDGFKPNGEAKFGMKVLISDPSAKIKRSDAQDAVIFVGGLNAKSTETEVKELFDGVGRVWLDSLWL